MELIPGICNDSAMEVSKFLDGLTTYYMSMVSHTWHNILTPSAYVPVYEVLNKAKSRHILHVLKFFRAGTLHPFTNNGLSIWNFKNLATNAASSGNEILVKFLLKSYSTGEWWRWAIYEAAVSKHRHIIKLITKANKRCISKSQRNVMLICAYATLGDYKIFRTAVKGYNTVPPMVYYYIGFGGNLKLIRDYAVPAFTRNILNGICASGNISILKQVLQNPLLNMYEKDMINACDIGFGGNIDILKLTQIRPLDALYSACENGHYDMVKYILSEEKSNVFISWEQIIRTACLYEHVEIICLLLGESFQQILAHNPDNYSYYYSYIRRMCVSERTAHRFLSASTLENYS